MTKTKVIQWATGRVGGASLREIIARPDLDLVGLYVSSEAKEGRDAGELAGGEPVGVIATRDKKALYQLDADVVCYSATDVLRTDEVHEEIRALLSSGKDVISTTDTRLLHPGSVGGDYIEQIEAACKRGGSTFHFTGISPGVMGDAMVFALSNLSGMVESIRVSEVLDISTYDPVMLQGCGFGFTPEEDAKNFSPDFLIYYWGAIVHFVAEELGLELDEVTTFRKTDVAPETFTIPSGLTIEKGTLAAMHWGVQGIKDGQVRVSAENFEILHPDMKPEWYHAPGGSGGYRVELVGTPNMTLDLSFGGEDPLQDAMVATGMCGVNAIPLVRAAGPGIVRAQKELPPAHGRFR